MSRLPSEINELIYQNLADVVFYLGVEGDKFRFVSVNPAFLKVTGLSREQVEGKLVEEVIPAESLQLVLDNYRKAINENKTVHWHEVTEYPTGTKFGNVTIVPIFDKNQKCYALLGTVHDVTAIKEAEHNLRITMERISDGLVAMDSNMNYTYVNNVAGKLFGRDPASLIGKNYWTEFPEARGTTFANNYLKALETQKFVEFDDYYSPWNRWFENRIFPSSNGITIYFSDITDRIEQDEELLEAKRAAEEATQAKSNFLDIAAHELRNPATTIYLMLHALLIKLENGETIDKEKLSKVLIPVDRLNRLVTDLLDVSRLQKNLVKLQKKQFDICDLTSQWIAELKLRYADKKINLDCQDKTLHLSLDEVRIYQVFTNLLENAIKYSPASTPINVVVKSTPTTVRVSIIDQGEGIPDEALPHLFDPFDRGGMDIKQRHNGLGLGLSICKRITSLHGGNIGVTSVVGKGSTFYFELPRES